MAEDTLRLPIPINESEAIVDEDHCHPNDLGHRIIADRVFEAIVRNCSFVACRMPRKTLIGEFQAAYGNGPEQPSGGKQTLQ